MFTHLDEHYQDLWLAELQRITAPDGLVVLSIHGEHAFKVSEQHLETDSRLRREWRAQLERDGILYIAEDTYAGSAFPDFYHTAFHAPWYVFEHWSRWFDVLAYLPQSSLDFQDQVVLRRRDDSGHDGASDPSAPARRRERVACATCEARGGDSGRTPADRPPMLVVLARLASWHGARYFGVARPVLHAQQDVDRSLADAISSLEARLTSACRRLCR